MADETSWKQWVAITRTQSVRPFKTYARSPVTCHLVLKVTYRHTYWLTDNQDCLWLRGLYALYAEHKTPKMVILVDLSAIFLGISTLSFGMEVEQMACLSHFQGPKRFAALLHQSDRRFQYHNEYRMPRSFVRTLPFKIYKHWSDHQKICHPRS